MLVKYNNCNVPSYRDDFFNDLVSRRYYGNGYGNSPAVNIIEEDNEFRIDVAAAGLSKSDFKIDLNDDVITVSAKTKEDKKERKQNYTRREFNYGAFNRSFKLADSIDQENIQAEHAEGVLTIHLPKKEESISKGPKEIEIS